MRTSVSRSTTAHCSLLVTAHFLLLAAICCAAPDAPTETAIIVGLNAEMQAFNPLINTDLNTTEVNYYMLFTPLIQYDAAFEPRPHLAESWDLTPDGVTFNLRRDVRWHDGRPVTAHDVEFTFRRAKDPETTSVLASVYLALIDSVTVIDSFTVHFGFSEPHARPLDGFWWPPVPRHLLEDVPPADMTKIPFNRNPVGSGPFRFVSWASGESVTLERVADFSDSLGGPAGSERVIFRFIPEATTLLSETLSGRVHVNASLQPAQLEEIERSTRVRLIAYPSREYYYIGWNTQDELLSDSRVRRALSMAIDRQQLVDALLYGKGSLATGTIPPWHPFFPALEPLPFDPEAARLSLAELGWADRDADGTIDSPVGVPFHFSLITNHENPVRTDIAQVVQAQLEAIGVDATVQTYEWQTLLARHRGRDFQAVVQSWVLDNFRVDPFALFHSSEAERRGSYNRSGLKDARVDELIERASRSIADDTASALWADFSVALQYAQPFTFLMWVDELVAVSHRIQNVEMDARGILVDVGDWRLDGDM